MRCDGSCDTCLELTPSFAQCRPISPTPRDPTLHWKYAMKNRVRLSRRTSSGGRLRGRSPTDPCGPRGLSRPPAHLDRRLCRRRRIGHAGPASGRGHGAGTGGAAGDREQARRRHQHRRRRCRAGGSRRLHRVHRRQRHLVFNPALFTKLPYDPAKDFRPVGLMARFPLVLAVRLDFPDRPTPRA